jgi:hypothetical protein
MKLRDSTRGAPVVGERAPSGCPLEPYNVSV